MLNIRKIARRVAENVPGAKTAFAAAMILAGIDSAMAAALAPMQGMTIDLGRGVHGIVYYVADDAGAYHLVATLDAGADSTPIRFKAVISDGQDVELSTPRDAGQPAQTVLIHRTGDKLRISASNDQAM